MREKDLTEKTLEKYDEVFADIINVLLFGGRETVKPEDLTDADPNSYYKAAGEVRSQERDVSKYWGYGRVRLAVYGIENQSNIDPMMPVRVLGYDGASYRNELAGTDGIIYPVVTLVLYFGHENRWDRGRRLKEVLDIPEGLEEYVSDYSINVFEIAYLDDETLAKFRSDFRILADYCVQMRKTGRYIPLKEGIVHPKELLEAMSALSGDRRYEESYNSYLRQHPDKGRRPTMDQYLTELINEGEAKGIAKGESKGRADAINDLVDRKMITPEQGRSYLEEIANKREVLTLHEDGVGYGEKG